MTKFDISLVDQADKYEKITLVEPNIIWNRPDIKYGDDFDVLKIEYRDKTQYIGFHINYKNTCIVGIWTTEIQRDVFNKMLRFLKKKYKRIKNFSFTHSLNNQKGLTPKVHWLLELPYRVDEYYNQFSAKARYNRKRERKLLQESFNCEFIHYSKEQLSEELIRRFFTFKTTTLKKKVHYDLDEAQEMLSDYYSISDVWAIKIDGEISAVILYSSVDGANFYCENMGYDLQYAHYNIGNILFYYSIEQLIERNAKKLFLGGGEFEYKKHCKAMKQKTYSGEIRASLAKRILRNIFEIKNVKDGQKKMLTICGVKFTFKKIHKKKNT
ncbi:MAG: GNAT family N-acetyltransferase [Alphaproteobacteria bacterium]|nr:GNAT family N-acetyltransferase [Alphaproteobacteria bacterium]